MKEINFYNDFNNEKAVKKKTKKINFPNSITSILPIILIILITAIGYGFMQYKLSSYESEENLINDELTTLQSVVKIKEDAKKYEQRINGMKSILNSVSDKSVINSQMFKNFSAAMPEDIYILNYSLSNKGEITFNGKAKNINSTAYFINKLKEVKIKDKNMFSDISIKNMIQNTKDNVKTDEYDFSIIAKLEK